MKWHRWTHGTTPETPSYDLVWIYTMDDEVELGYWDSGWWCLWSGSDDVHVIAWSPFFYPAEPEQGRQWIQDEINSWEDE